ncbi:MAG TPA: cysteine--tRNA ligase [Thermoanaerobaculales bacterium]|nr:cysteine--tRNA ligase [Thermoanaerobaculales bacterium]HPA79838.1 cysteine--tRNA ligase [Thermoanaerobaculales bacterium]HQL29801.1 cysteine--tRNA ligase [Thermoanaerobaculales bacterium]HQN94861.1 cysteine--tRNA ligase [Thermoanaerobaculales bacterium]HQP42975.1 cysteine--tRNA ligase [Thermoanaerobaculales bacterium]
MTSQLHLYNTLTRRLEPFASLEPGHARVYTCGPTIYDYSHIGNFRTFLFEDILRRTLRLFGYRVTQVMNLTDVDDKTIRGASAEGVSLREYTDRYAAAFFQDLDTLRVERAERYPRATDHIPGMVELVRRLEAAGHTYRSEGSVYFRIASFPGYGKLSGVRPGSNLAGARVDADEYEKEDARDFVLWKAAKPGEPAWETALGPGRPGWHLECSAMSMEALGESFDIHCGGVDNIFPHHENEIAQSEGATGRPFARYWLHAEHLTVEGEKMAKSLGNFFTLRDLLERGHDPLAIRYLLISVPYRQKLNFTFDGLHAAGQALERVANTLRRLEHSPAAASAGALAADDVAGFRLRFRAALADDLNTARALAELHDLLRAVNTALDGGGISGLVREELARAMAEADSVLGVLPARAGAAADGDAEVAGLVEERTAARAARDFARADAIRARLAEIGVVIEDTPHGTVWHRKPSRG